MRKTFLTFCVAALSLLVVSSCGKIWDEFDVVHGEIDDLKTRVEQLEKDLNDAVATINAKIGALETAQKADEELFKSLKAKDEALAAELSALTAELDALDGSIDGKISAAKDEVLAKITELTGSLNSKYEELKGKDAEVLAALAAVGVTKVEKNDAGNVVLTFTDGSTVVVGQYDPNANNTGVVTVVEENGVKYWAVVKADGTVESLGVEVGNTEVELQFEVNAETGELSYSIDGGTTWVPTGVVIPEPAEDCLLTDFYQGAEFDYDLWEEVVDDYYTLVFGGVEYYLPIYKVDNSVVTIKAGKTYFSYEESKVIEVVVSDVTAMYVMTKPDGWRAKLDGKKLTVTAPVEANVTSGVAEAEGEVLLHCTTTEGKCKIAKLYVTTSGGFSLTVAEDGTVRIVNPEVVTTTNPMMGWETTDFNDAYIGLAPIAAFEADPVAYVQGIQDNYDDKWIFINNWKSNTADYDEDWNVIYKVGGMYEPGVYEVDVIETTVPEMYSDWTYGAEMPKGSRFVVWACPMNEEGMPRITDLVFGYYAAPITAEIKVVENGITTSDIEVSIEVVGADSYYVGVLPEEYMYGFPVDDYMQNQEGPFGYFQMAIQYGMPEYAFQQMGMLFGGEYGMEMPATIKASEINGGALMPDMKVYMWVFPVVDGLDLADYTYEKNLKPYIYEFTTAGLSAGGSAEVEFSNASLGYTSMSVDLTATAGSTMIYYKWYEADAYNDIDDVTADLLENGYVLSGESGTARNDNNILPGSSFVLASLAIDADGKYGEVNEATYVAPEIVYSTTFSATFGEETSSVYYSGYKYDFSVDVTGGTAAKYYYVFSTTEYTAEQLANLPLTYDYNYNFRSATSLKGLYANANTTYYLAVVVESADGELSPVITKTVNVPAVPAE